MMRFVQGGVVNVESPRFVNSKMLLLYIMKIVLGGQSMLKGFSGRNSSLKRKNRMVKNLKKETKNILLQPHKNQSSRAKLPGEAYVRSTARAGCLPQPWGAVPCIRSGRSPPADMQSSIARSQRELRLALLRPNLANTYAHE